MKIITIHDTIPDNIYGYDRSQLCREEIFKEDDYQIVYTSLYDVNFSNYVNHMKQLGFNQFYHILLDKSDIARKEPSLNIDDVVLDKTIKQLTLNSDNYVERIDFVDGTFRLYTSHLFLECNSEWIKIYNADGTYITVTNTESYQTIVEYQKNQMELLIDLLQTADVIIRDSAQPLPIVLKRYFLNTNKTLFHFVHYDIDSAVSLPFSTSWAKLIYTNKLLADKYKGDFLPPIFADSMAKSEEFLDGYCVVASSNKYKRVLDIIEYFKTKPSQRLFVYGHSDYGDLSSYPNIVLCGNVTRVPYEKHYGYISNSYTESFSNALVEALASHLICLVSSDALAHQWHAQDNDNVYLYDTIDELNQLIETRPRAKYIDNYYIKDCVKERYRDYFKNT